MELENIIIGAGPAGLAVAGRMRNQGMPFEMIDANDRIGYSWHNHYDRLHLHTVKQLSHLPLVPFPENYPTYVSRAQFVDYLEKYAVKFDIHPRFLQTVQHIRKNGEIWEVCIEGQHPVATKNVILATGVNRLPVSPEWNGQSVYQGKIIHSRFYKNAEPFRGQKVLVVGMGNTGAELALDLSENDVETYISVRSPISVVPRDLNGRPVQTTSKQLAKLPFGMGDWLGSQIRKIYFGNLEKYGLTASKMHPAVQLRETGKTPIVDIGTINAIKKGRIVVVPEVLKLTEKGVVLKNDTLLDVDQIIMATGYTAGLEKLIPGFHNQLDQYGLPRSSISTDEWRGLYFCGYDNYKLGGILGTIQTDSLKIINYIMSQ